MLGLAGSGRLSRLFAWLATDRRGTAAAVLLLVAAAGIAGALLL